MSTDALDALSDVMDALEDACRLMVRLDRDFGLTEEQDRVMASMSYDHDRLADDYNRMEKEYVNYEL